MNIFIFFSFLLPYACAYQVRVLSSNLNNFRAKSIAVKDGRLLRWSRTELSELANILAEKLLNDPKYWSTEFVEQSASKYYVDADSLDSLFRQMEIDGLALRTQIYEEIKQAGLLEDKGEIKDVLRVAPIFHELSQRERDNLRITDQKVIQKINARNLIKATKLSTTPKRVKTVGNFVENKKNENLLWKTRKITSKVAVVEEEEEKSKIKQKYLKKKESAKIFKEKSKKLEKELSDKNMEILEMKKSEIDNKMKNEQLENELENRRKQMNEQMKKAIEKEFELKENAKNLNEKCQKLEKELNGKNIEISEMKRSEMKNEQLVKELMQKEAQIAKLKNGGGNGTVKTDNENGGIFSKIFGGSGGGNEENRVKSLENKLNVKERELFDLDRNISMKKRQLQNIESKMDQPNTKTNDIFKTRNETENGMKKVQFAHHLNTILQRKIEQKFKNAKDNESAAEEADDEAVVIKAPRQIRTLKLRNKTSAPHHEADLKNKPTNLTHRNTIATRQNTPYIQNVINSKIKNDESADDKEFETQVIKTPRRIVTLSKRNKHNPNSAPDYEADVETEAARQKRRKTIEPNKIERVKTTVKNNGYNGTVAFEALSPPWARKSTTKKNV